ncbi:MAG: hypothetical protein R3F16_00665 [Myxococcota bacterium]|nr:hypothetical protein [Myxococcales bacterium]
MLDRVLGFRGRPGYARVDVSPLDPTRQHEVRLDRDGFRGRPLPAVGKSAETTRVAVFGDSFVVGEGVAASDLMTARLERALEVSGRKAEVYALGAIDYGTGQELLLLDRLGPRLRPDQIVLVLYPSNDVVNNAWGLAGATTVSPGDAIRPYLAVDAAGRLSTRWIGPVRSWLRRHLTSFGHAELLLAPPDLGRLDPRSVEARIEAGLPPREYLEVFRTHDEHDRWEVAWRETEVLIRAFRDRCEALGARLVVLVVPSIDQVVMTPQRIGFEIEARAHGRRLEDWVDWSLPERRLAAFFAAEGIEAQALLAPLRAAVREGNPVYARDLHLNEAGHAIAARVLSQALSLPASAPPPGIDVAAIQSGTAVVLDPASDPSFLDLRVAPYAAAFSDGWVDWRPAGAVAGHPGGWRLGLRGLVAVRAADGPLALRIHALRPGRVGVSVLGGGPQRQVEIPRAGPFALRIPMDPPPVLSEDGHLALILSGGPDPGSLILQAIGFEEAAAAGPPAPGEMSVTFSAGPR